MLYSAVVLVIVLSLLIFVHEFGHFITAKLSGMRVDEFGFGFPPRIFGVKRGGTVYSVNWIPIGGFVKIKGEDGGGSRDRDSFASRKPWQRATVIVAGVVMNMALAWLLLSIGYVIGLPQVVDDPPYAATVRDARIQVFSVLADSPADTGGLEAGDIILEVNGQEVTDSESFRQFTASMEGRPIDLKLRRDGGEIGAKLVPRQLSETGRAGIGIAVVKTGLVSYPAWLAPAAALESVAYFFKAIVVALADVIREIFVEARVTPDLSGPVGIAVLTAEVAKLGFRYILQFTALLSVNLAVINVLPLPALDGGRLLFLGIEAVRGKAVSVKIEGITHRIGFALLMVLVLAITFRDVIRFGDRITGAFLRVFGL
jgi:regulator of sigma E protease